MQVAQIKFENFRGIKSGTIFLPKHGVLVGDNNTGKTSVLEAIDLVLGPDRLNRYPPIDEHDFYKGQYLARHVNPPATDQAEEPAQDQVTQGSDITSLPKITIEVTITDLNEEQKARFYDEIEFWDSMTDELYELPDPSGIDSDNIHPALRVTFIGNYVIEEDDFEGKTFFTRTLVESDRPTVFTKAHKLLCGFLYLRSHRSGYRALSLERGSLLDIILRLKEVRPEMWEDTLDGLKSLTVAEKPELGISGILETVNSSLKKYTPREWGVEPHLKVSNLTRNHLRKTITAFLSTGSGTHSAPFYRQGTGTINMLVLALLSQIAEGRQNVIFAMEEPETAIPPYAQKRIVHEVSSLASQTIFTSHSPYVLEEFDLSNTVILTRDEHDHLSRAEIKLPKSIKGKRYRQQFRTRFCEGLLARRVLIVEGNSEYNAFPAACRRLAYLEPERFSPLEGMGICTIDAGGEGSIADLASLYTSLGKSTYALCDKQTKKNRERIEGEVVRLFMHEEVGFENLVLKNTKKKAIKRFAKSIDWPSKVLARHDKPDEDPIAAIETLFKEYKGEGYIADFLAQCSVEEMPKWIKKSCRSLHKLASS